MHGEMPAASAGMTGLERGKCEQSLAQKHRDQPRQRVGLVRLGHVVRLGQRRLRMPAPWSMMVVDWGTSPVAEASTQVGVSRLTPDDCQSPAVFAAIRPFDHFVENNFTR